MKKQTDFSAEHALYLKDLRKKSVLVQIADYFEVSLDYLLGRSDY